MTSYLKRRTVTRRALTALLLVSVAVLAAVGFIRSGSSFPRPAVGNNLPTMAPDMDLQVHGFQYSDYLGDNCAVSIKARCMTRRGRQIMDFRSNLIKDNLFEGVTGRLRSSRSEVIFACGRAEGTIGSASALALTGNVALKIDGQPIPVRRSARIFFKRHTIEIDDIKVIYY